MHHHHSTLTMFYSANFPRYVAELGLFALLVFVGICMNSQALIALGILVLSHCLPSLVLATLRHSVPSLKSNVTTLYSNSFFNFRENEAVVLISHSLIIGVSTGLLFFSLQELSFAQLINKNTLLIVAASYIMLEVFLYCMANIRYKLKREVVKKPLPSRVIRLVVASMMVVIATIEHEWLRNGLDLLVGLSVLFYITYESLITLFKVAKRHFTYTPNGIEVDKVKLFIRNLPGVERVEKVYFRRINELEYELGVQLSLHPFIQANTVELIHKIKQQISQAFGIFNVAIDLVLPIQPPPTPPQDDSVIILGQGD